MSTTTLIKIIIGLFLLLSLINIGCDSASVPVKKHSLIPDSDQLALSEAAEFISGLEKLPIAQRVRAVQDFLSRYPSSPVTEKNSLALFYWYGKAETVLISGDIQSAWTVPDTMISISCGSEKLFYKIYSLPSDTRFDYLYIIDGISTIDPNNPEIVPSGFGSHSQCRMPGFNPKNIMLYRNSIFHGETDTIFFSSKITSMLPRMLVIHQPAGYDTLSKLPVIYVNDGIKALEYNSYVNVLDNLISDKQIRPAIAVFIGFSEGDQDYFLNRTDDYIMMICNELVPLIDGKYRTNPDPRSRILTGVSAGGTASLLTALKRPDIFLNAASQSANVTGTLLSAVSEMKNLAGSDQKSKFYFDVGRFDLLSSNFNNHTYLYANQILSRAMRKAGINFNFRVVNDGHQWYNWRERTDEILKVFLD